LRRDRLDLLNFGTDAFGDGVAPRLPRPDGAGVDPQHPRQGLDRQAQELAHSLEFPAIHAAGPRTTAGADERRISHSAGSTIQSEPLMSLVLLDDPPVVSGSHGHPSAPSRASVSMIKAISRSATSGSSYVQPPE